MNKYVKWCCTLMTAVMMTGLIAGCGDSGDSKDIKIGMVYELTGNTASYGTSALNGAKLALKEINANGGALGKQITTAVADNKGDPAESANAMTKVISQDKAVAVTGIITSSNAISASAVAEANKIPFLTVGATNPRVTIDEKSGQVKENTFRVCFIDPFQGTVGGNFALNTLKVKKVVTLIDNSSDYSKGLAQFFKDVFTKGGGQVIDEQAYLQKDQDFKTILTKIKAENPDLIYLPGYYDEVGKIVKQARELGINIPFLGGDGWDSSKLVEIAGAENLNNTYFTTHYSVDNKSPKSTAFVEAYQKEYNQLPDVQAVLSYDAVYVLVDAIKRAGSADPAKIREALAQTKDFEAVSGKITLNDKHDAVKSAVIIEFKNGKQTFKTTVEPN